MPIACPVSLPRLTTAECRELDYQIMESAFETHREVGRLADEGIYQSDFAMRLRSRGWTAECEVPVTVSFGTFVKTYRLDLVVGDRLLYELKVVAKLTSAHEAQLMNYLMMLDGSRGKLVNFRQTSVVSRFVNSPMNGEERRSFEVDETSWCGESRVRDCIISMLRDWGTALELSLYVEAAGHLLGFSPELPTLLPMIRDSTPLGNQRFHLISPDEAIRITAFPRLSGGYENDLRRLLRLSPLRAIHWINIGYHQVRFHSIT